jgi:hypothetical protein
MTHPSCESSQGELFETTVESSGTTDPNIPGIVTTQFTLHDGTGFYPELRKAEDTSPATELNQSAVIAAAHDEARTRRRHQAQLGKHSPLVRDGTYMTVKPGDVLPGFGVVTHSNFTDALMHAGRLETKRSQR